MQQNFLVIALTCLLISACSKQKEESANPSVEGTMKTTLTEPINQVDASAPDQPEANTSTAEQLRGEQAAAKVMQQYNKEKENAKYENYAKAIVSAIDEPDGGFQMELDSATESSSLFQSSGIKDMKFIKGDDHSATYQIKIGLMRGGHVESQCSIDATYDDSIGQINWKIPQKCFDF